MEKGLNNQENNQDDMKLYIIPIYIVVFIGIVFGFMFGFLTVLITKYEMPNLVSFIIISSGLAIIGGLIGLGFALTLKNGH